MKTAMLLAIGVLVGFLGLATYRYVTFKDASVHYHANFAVYINGQRERFSEHTYYEEVAVCTADAAKDPHSRVHMHEQVSDVVHIHDEGVTWGQFFENLGWSISPEHLKTLDHLYTNAALSKISFILNDRKVDDVSNLVIKTKDKLLINYGDQSEPALIQEFQTISDSAQAHNTTPDPASCGGQVDTGWQARLREVFN